MLKIITNIYDLDIPQLASLYEDDSNPFSQDIYCALSDFFSDQKRYYAVWEEAGRYCSALRIEQHENGVLITGLQTAPALRNSGYGKKLLLSVTEHCCCQGVRRLYSHVHKRNGPSNAVHRACGFSVVSDYAKLLDGTVSAMYHTYCFQVD